MSGGGAGALDLAGQAAHQRAQVGVERGVGQAAVDEGLEGRPDTHGVLEDVRTGDPQDLDAVLAFLDLGPFNTVAALVIAVFKATLVVLFFMHVKYSTRLTWAVVVGSVFWLGILLVLTMSDYLTRAWRTYG